MPCKCPVSKLLFSPDSMMLRITRAIGKQSYFHKAELYKGGFSFAEYKWCMNCSQCLEVSLTLHFEEL